MINLLFFNPLNHFPIVHLVGTNHCPAVTYVALTASVGWHKMTSKRFLPQAFANYQPPVLGVDPSSVRVNRVTPTAGHYKDQTLVQPVWQPSMKPCYDDGINGTGLRGFGEETSLTALTCLQKPPRADRHRDLWQMFGKTAPFVMALLWNLFELLLFIWRRTCRRHSQKSLIKQILESHTDRDRHTL